MNMGVLYTLTSRINQSISIQHATTKHLFDCTEGVKTKKKIYVMVAYCLLFVA